MLYASQAYEAENRSIAIPQPANSLRYAIGEILPPARWTAYAIAAFVSIMVTRNVTAYAMGAMMVSWIAEAIRGPPIRNQKT